MEQIPNEAVDNSVETQELDTTGFDELQKAFEGIEALKASGKLYEEEDQGQEEPEKEEIEEDQDALVDLPDLQFQEEEPDQQEIEEAPEPEENKIRQRERQTLREQKRKTYAVIQEKRAMEARAIAAEARIQELDQLLGHSVNSAVHHYGKTVYGNLERAKQDKQSALDAGDTRQLIEAEINLTKALNAVNELEKLENNNLSKAGNYSPYYPAAPEAPSYQQQYQPQYQPQYNNNPYPPSPPKAENNYQELHREIAADWRATHPYLHPSSKNYDRELDDKVDDFVTALDTELQAKGGMNMYFSDAYFNAIDKFIADNRRPLAKKSDTRSAATESHIGGVRNSYSGSPSSKSSNQQVKLTPDELIMIENIPGMTRETYLKYKIQEMKKNNKQR